MTGWLPVLSMMVGPNWGIVSPPALNSQAFIVPQEGRADHGVVVGMTYNVQDAPPQPGGSAVGEGQFALVHKNGSYLLFNDDDVVLVTNRDLLATVGRDAKVLAKGSLTASAPTVTIDADGQGGNTTVKLDGDLHVTGTVVAGFGTGDQVSVQTHRHGTTGPVASQTIPPSPGT
jgi:phage gp45-like